MVSITSKFTALVHVYRRYTGTLSPIVLKEACSAAGLKKKKKIPVFWGSDDAERDWENVSYTSEGSVSHINVFSLAS